MSFSESAVIKDLIQEDKGLAQAAAKLAAEPEAQVAVLQGQMADITQDVKAVVVCTQAEYDALSPSATTLYIITD